MKKNLVIIGSTGSVGSQSVEVVKRMSDLFNVVALVADSDREKLLRQAKEVNAERVGLFSSKKNEEGIIAGEDCYKLCALPNVDYVLIAATGLSALPYFVEALKAGKTVCASNKESIVAVGTLLKELVKEYGGKMIPVDSEHSAVFQSIGENRSYLKRIILTASGGPFFGKKKEELFGVCLADALNHPTWKMGKKITVDSATLANKGLEVIEACRLFDVSESNVDVIVHRESVVHSLVEFVDGAVISQSSYPTMELPIQLSLTYPQRLGTTVKPLDLGSIGKFTFYPLDNEAFPFVELSRRVERMGGFYPLCYSSADEVAVEAFINGEIGFTDIYKVVEKTVNTVQNLPEFLIENAFIADNIVRERAKRVILEREF